MLGQERAKELTAHEEQLEEWKKRFKAEALRQIGERERALSEWQAQLDAKRADLEDLKRNMEVCPDSLGTADLPSITATDACKQAEVASGVFIA